MSALDVVARVALIMLLVGFVVVVVRADVHQARWLAEHAWVGACASPVVMALALGVAAWLRSAAIASWTRAAEARGLQLTPGVLRVGWRMQGEVDGVHVEVLTQRRRYSTLTTTRRRLMTVTRAKLGPLPPGLLVTRQALAERLAVALGGQDVTVGHDELDRRLRFEGPDEAAVRAFVARPGVAPALRALADEPGLRVDADGVTIEAPGFDADGQRLGRRIDLAVALASATRAGG